ncbi:hypothetical protein AAHE18_16G194100 [Arachis hypogaea]
MNHVSLFVLTFLQIVRPGAFVRVPNSSNKCSGAVHFFGEEFIIIGCFDGHENPPHSPPHMQPSDQRYFLAPSTTLLVSVPT